MLSYVIRRLGYGVMVVFGVLLFLFILFFAVTDPDDVARKALGDRVPPAVIEQWKVNHGYDRQLFPGPGAWTDNMLVEHYRRMLTFDFGTSDADDTPIMRRIKDGIGPSLVLTVPLFVLSLGLSIPMALFVAFSRSWSVCSRGSVGTSVSTVRYFWKSRVRTTCGRPAPRAAARSAPCHTTCFAIR